MMTMSDSVIHTQTHLGDCLWETSHLVSLMFHADMVYAMVISRLVKNIH